jgi:tRNA-modifying protein YgfZ
MLRISGQKYAWRVIATSEYELATESVGMLARSEHAQFVVRGSEAGDFLQGQVSNDVEGLAPGEGCYAALLNAKGKIRTDMRVLRDGDAFWIDAEGIAREVIAHMIQTYSIGRDVQFEDVSESRALVSLIGPAAADRLDAAPPATENAWVDGAHGRYVRTDLGIDVIGAPNLADALDVDPIGAETAECLRIESGRPRLGYDMGGDTIPQEAGINERAISFTKGCYVGQETVARLHYKGKPNRHLRGLRLSEPVERGAELRFGEKMVGRVGSACVSPRLGPIALALVRREAAPGDTLVVDGGGEAEVVELPFPRS